MPKATIPIKDNIKNVHINLSGYSKTRGEDTYGKCDVEALANLKTSKLLPFVFWKPLNCTLAISENPDEMQHNAAFYQGLHCLLRLKQPPETEIYHTSDNSTRDPLKYKMNNLIFIVSICMEKSISIQRVKHLFYLGFHFYAIM